MNTRFCGRIASAWVVAVALVIVLPGAAGADWMGQYFNAIVGTEWTYELIGHPGITKTRSTFDFFEYEGLPVTRLGEDAFNHMIVANDGRVLTVVAMMEDGALIDLPENFVLAEFQDGSRFTFCPSAVDCDSNLIRFWSDLDPSLRSIYGIDPAPGPMILIANYDADYDRNLHNTVMESNLPDGVEVPIGAITNIEWYLWKVGLYAELDVDAPSGGFEDQWILIDFVTDVPTETQPVGARLAQNRPNPFNPRTTIVYDLDRAAPVTLRIYDCAGRLVRTLIRDRMQTTGRHAQPWDGLDGQGRSAPSGTYLYRLEAGASVLTRRMVLLR